MTILEKLPLARIRFDLETLESATVPAYKGDFLRMALLWWLSEYWCPMPTRCRHGCRQPEVCLFGQLCEPTVDPAWPNDVRRLVGDTPPPAYTLWDLQDRRGYFSAGSSWSFELTLAGELALRQIPAIVAAIQQGVEQGMGRIRLRSRVLRVEARQGTRSDSEPVCLAAQQEPGDGTALIWQSFRLADFIIGYRHGIQWAEGLPQTVSTLSLRYLSPIKIKERGQWVDVPHFGSVVKALVRRLRILSVIHGAGEWPHGEWGPLLDLADTITLDHHETLWTGYTRRSKSSGQQELEGFVGQAWYTGQDFRPLLPLLWLGQWLHIGKGYVLGNGRYAIEQMLC